MVIIHLNCMKEVSIKNIHVAVEDLAFREKLVFVADDELAISLKKICYFTI